MKQKILVVDDESEAVELVEFNLKQAGFEVVTAADGEEAVKKAKASLPALVVLDLMLPEIDGLEVCKLLRRDAATAKIPILMLTAKAAEIDRVLGLEIGADDYVTKPFSPRELILRIKKILERGQTKAEIRETMRYGDLQIDIPKHRATWKGKPFDLTATEFKLLTILAQRAGRVQSRDALLRDVRGLEISRYGAWCRVSVCGVNQRWLNCHRSDQNSVFRPSHSAFSSCCPQ
jgi:DNA-binding response OmpR family regulator